MATGPVHSPGSEKRAHEEERFAPTLKFSREKAEPFSL